mgnify:CR=1 FL=1
MSRIHAASIHLRTATIHSLSRRPVTSAATAKAKGTAQVTKPAYSAGGCTIIQGLRSRAFSPSPSGRGPVAKVWNGLATKTISTPKKPTTTMRVAMTQG